MRACTTQLSNFKSISKRGLNTLTNIPLQKGTVPKRLDLCFYFGTFYTINLYLLIKVFNWLQERFLCTVSHHLDLGLSYSAIIALHGFRDPADGPVVSGHTLLSDENYVSCA